MGFMNGRGSYQYNNCDMVERGVENEEKMETDRHNNSLTMDETVVNGGEDIMVAENIIPAKPASIPTFNKTQDVCSFLAREEVGENVVADASCIIIHHAGEEPHCGGDHV